MKKFGLDWYIYLILLVALLIRLPGIINGLPAVYNSTEYFLAKTALGMGASRTIDPGIYIYPTFYTYLLLFLFGCLYLSGSLFGFFETSYDFAVQFLIDPSAFYILTRTVNVGLSLATIFLLYKILKNQFNENIVRIAAAFMAVSFYMIRFSDFATADTLLIFFSTLAILYIYHFSDSANVKVCLYAGIFSGLAIGAKYNAGFLVIGLLMAVFQKWRTQKIQVLPAIGLSLGGVAMGFFITNPLWLIYPERFYQGWQLISAQMYSAVSAERGEPFLWEIITLIQDEMVIGVLFIAATLYYFFNGERKHYPGLVVILLTFLFVGTWTKKGIDYLFVAFPAWIILSSAFADQISRKYIQKKAYKIILILLIFLPSFFGAVHQVMLYINQDTREQATEWLISNIEHDQKVCYDNYHIDLGVFDIQRYLSYGASVDKIPDPVKQSLQIFSTDPRQINFVPILVANPSYTLKTDNPYETEAVRNRRRVLSELLRSNTTILISNSWYYSSYLSVNMRDYPLGVQISIKEVQDFYEQLFKNFESVKIFKPDFWTPGPEISIYNLNQMRQKEE